MIGQGFSTWHDKIIPMLLSARDLASIGPAKLSIPTCPTEVSVPKVRKFFKAMSVKDRIIQPLQWVEQNINGCAELPELAQVLLDFLQNIIVGRFHVYFIWLYR